MFTHADMRASHSATRRFAHFRTSASVCSSITPPSPALRSEEHTSELQSQSNLVCRLLLEKKKHRCHEHYQDKQIYNIATIEFSKVHLSRAHNLQRRQQRENSVFHDIDVNLSHESEVDAKS